MVATTEPVLEGHRFGLEQVVYGDCDGEEPMIIARVEIDRTNEHEDLEYKPRTYEEFMEDGTRYRRPVIGVGCENYQRLVELGAPVLACAGCPAASEAAPQT